MRRYEGDKVCLWTRRQRKAKSQKLEMEKLEMFQQGVAFNVVVVVVGVVVPDSRASPSHVL